MQMLDNDDGDREQNHPHSPQNFKPDIYGNQRYQRIKPDMVTDNLWLEDISDDEEGDEYQGRVGPDQPCQGKKEKTFNVRRPTLLPSGSWRMKNPRISG